MPVTREKVLNTDKTPEGYFVRDGIVWLTENGEETSTRVSLESFDLYWQVYLRIPASSQEAKVDLATTLLNDVLSYSETRFVHSCQSALNIMRQNAEKPWIRDCGAAVLEAAFDILEGLAEEGRLG